MTPLMTYSSRGIAQAERDLGVTDCSQVTFDSLARDKQMCDKESVLTPGMGMGLILSTVSRRG